MDFTLVQWFVHFLLLIISCYLGNLFANRQSLKAFEKIKRDMGELWAAYIEEKNHHLMEKLKAEREAFLTSLRELEKDIDRANAEHNNI